MLPAGSGGGQVTLHYGVNAHLLGMGTSYRAAGISRSILNLLRFAPPELRDDERLTAYAGPGAPPEAIVTTPRFALLQSRIPTARPSVRIGWEQALLPLAAWRDRLSVLHCPAYARTVFTHVPTVVTVHDLSFLRFPYAFNRGNRVYLAAMTRWSVRTATSLVAVSFATRRELVDLLGVPEDRVHVVQHGIEPEFAPVAAPATIADFRARRQLPERFILCVATLEPRKNLAALVRGFARAGGLRGTGCKLVLAGGRGWRYEEIFRAVEECGLGDEVVVPGVVPMADLPLWYNAADLFVYPSRYEGFGMPVLEAMACGTPVVTTRAAALAEVAGSACVLVKPDDVDELAEALSALAGSPQRRAELGAAGLVRAREFSWSQSARSTLDIYRSAALQGR